MTREIIDPVAKLKSKILDEKLEEKKIIKKRFSSEIQNMELVIHKIGNKTGIETARVAEIIAEILDKGRGGSLCVMML